MKRTREDLQRIIRAAIGELKADLIITGGKLINVYSGEILTGIEIAILDGRICYVGRSAKHTRGGATEILDAAGCHISPGFIDGHTHFGHYARPFENLQSFLPRGTTAVVASCDELSAVFGYRGLELFLDEVERHPLRVYTLVSMAAPQDPLLCNCATFTDAEIAAALADPRVLGMGEIVSWLRLTQCDDEILNRLVLALGSGQIFTVIRPAGATKSCAPLPRREFPLAMSRFTLKTLWNACDSVTGRCCARARCDRI